MISMISGSLNEIYMGHYSLTILDVADKVLISHRALTRHLLFLIVINIFTDKNSDLSPIDFSAAQSTEDGWKKVGYSFIQKFPRNNVCSVIELINKVTVYECCIHC